MKTIAQIKSELQTSTLDFFDFEGNTTVNSSTGEVTTWLSAWVDHKDGTRTCVMCPEDTLLEVTKNVEFDRLALKDNGVKSPEGKRPYRLLVIITPTKEAKYSV